VVLVTFFVVLGTTLPAAATLAGTTETAGNAKSKIMIYPQKPGFLLRERRMESTETLCGTILNAR
jgi:hypothetical protein